MSVFTLCTCAAPSERPSDRLALADKPETDQRDSPEVRQSEHRELRAATMATTADIPAMDVLLHCVICTDEFSSPKLLSCGHTFCASCVQQLINVAAQGQFSRILRSFPCPVCRQTIRIPPDGVTGFQDDFRVSQIREAFEAVARAGPTEQGNCEFCVSQKRQVPATFTCLQCHKQMCDGCLQKHAARPHFKSHTVVRNDQPSSSVTCKDHNESCGFVCTQCSKMVCVTCVMTSCSAHDNAVEEVKVVAEQRKNEIKRITNMVEMRVAEMEHKMIQLNFLETNKANMLNDIETAIKNKAQNVIQRVRDNESGLLGEVDEYRRAVIGEIQNARSEAELELGMLCSLRDAVESAAEPGMEVQLVAAYPSFKSKVANKTSYTYTPSKKTSSKLVFKPEDHIKVGAIKRKKDEQLLSSLRNLDAGEAPEPININTSSSSDQADISSTELAAELDTVFTESCSLAAAETRTLTLSRRNLRRSMHSLEEVEERPYLHSTLSWQITGLGDGCDVTFLPNGHLAISDSTHKKVVMYNRDGDVVVDSKRANNQADIFQRPKGIAFHSQLGAILVADPDSHCLKLLDPTTLRYMSDLVLAQVQEPHGVAVMTDGKIIVTEAGDRRHGVSIHSPRGACRKMWGTQGSRMNSLRSRWLHRSPEAQFNFPLFTTVDTHDRIIVSDLLNNSVHFFDCEGRLLHRFGNGSNAELPRGVCVDPNNVILVAHSAGLGESSHVTAFTTDGRLVNTVVEWDGCDVQRCGNISSLAMSGTRLATVSEKAVQLYECSVPDGFPGSTTCAAT